MEALTRTDASAKNGHYFLLGRWTSLLEQCLRLLREKADAAYLYNDKFFQAKLRETIFNVEAFARQLASGDDLGALLAGASAEEFAENRFCEHASSFFKLRLYVLTRWIVGSENFMGDEDEAFVSSQFLDLFLERPDGTGPSLELRPLGVPSLDWLRDGEPGACFRLLDLCMQSLIDTCVVRELDFSEIERLGTGSGELERYKAGLEIGSPSETEAAKFWAEMAASLLSNSLAIDRALLLTLQMREFVAERLGGGITRRASDRESEGDSEESSECPSLGAPAFELGSREH